MGPRPPPVSIIIPHGNSVPRLYRLGSARARSFRRGQVLAVAARLDPRFCGADQDRRLAGTGPLPPGRDPLAATEFTYTRFLTPALAGYQGWALFCDCDFLWLGDIAGLLDYTRSQKAVYCVQHDYRPTEKTKMDGAVQTVYPRKNWSSLMLFNCDHPSVRGLTPEVVNRESGAYLHRMQWAKDDEIGALPVDWNWLEGWNEKPSLGTPKAVHFTRGGPWFEQWRNVDYGDLWLAERAAMERSGKPLP